MREIKFRGRDEHGKWHYGDLLSWPIIRSFNGLNYEYKEVAADTVGQYTGLKDATGKEIYEGDIVKLSPQFSVKQGLKREFRFPAVVRWDERLVRFSLRSMEIIDSLRDSEYITVIGNVHDNPELLEAQA